MCGYRANLAAGMEGGVQLELGWVGEPMGLWHSTSEVMHSRARRCQRAVGGVYAQPASHLPMGLVQHHNIRGTICFSPPNPPAKAKISTEEAKLILCCPTKTSSCWNAPDEIPTVFTDGDTAIHPHIRPAQNHKTPFLFPTA